MHTLSKLLYSIPFELNANQPLLQLQLTEHFEISYFDSTEDHRIVRRHRDSGASPNEDTGIKITLMYFLCKDGSEMTFRHWNSPDEVAKEESSQI